MTMHRPAANPYLRTQILTASGEELRLLLYDGAIKFTSHGKTALESRDFEAVYENLTRAQNIVLELLTSINRDEDKELSDRLASLYSYMYRRLIDASMNRDPGAAGEVVTLLQYERETWRMAMDKADQERRQSPDGPPATPTPPQRRMSGYGSSPQGNPAGGRLSQSA